VSDITDALSQADIEDSLLDAPIVAQLRGDAPFVSGDQTDEGDGPQQSIYADGVALLQEELKDDDPEGVGLPAVLKYGDAEVERRIAERGGQPEQEQPQERLRSERAPQESEQQEQPQRIADPTPEQVRDTIQHLDTMSEQFQLNEGSREFAARLEPLLGPEVYKNEAQISNAVSRYTISAREDVLNQVKATGGFDANQVTPLSPAMVREGSRAIASFFGINPQLTPLHDESRVANFGRLAFANFAYTWGQSDGKTPVSELNDGNLAVWIVQNIAYGLTGTTEPVNRKWAVDFVNAITERASKLFPKIREGLEGSGQQKQPRARGQRIPAGLRDGIRGSKGPRKFQTNSGPDDPFDPQTMATYHERTARL